MHYIELEEDKKHILQCLVIPIFNILFLTGLLTLSIYSTISPHTQSNCMNVYNNTALCNKNNTFILWITILGCFCLTIITLTLGLIYACEQKTFVVYNIIVFMVWIAAFILSIA